jgi:hypothetical protein
MTSGERSVVVSLDDDEMEYLSGHVIDGRNLFPAMGYLVSFTLLLMYMKLIFNSCSVLCQLLFTLISKFILITESRF